MQLESQGNDKGLHDARRIIKKKANTCSNNHNVQERYKKHKQSERKSFYMRPESLCNKKYTIWD